MLLFERGLGCLGTSDSELRKGRVKEGGVDLACNPSGGFRFSCAHRLVPYPFDWLPSFELKCQNMGVV